MELLSSSLTSQVVASVILQAHSPEGCRETEAPWTLNKMLALGKAITLPYLLPFGRDPFLVQGESTQDSVLRPRKLDVNYCLAGQARVQVRAWTGNMSVASQWIAETLWNRESNLSLLLTIFTLLAKTTFQTAEIVRCCIILAVAYLSKGHRAMWQALSTSYLWLRVIKNKKCLKMLTCSKCLW